MQHSYADYLRLESESPLKLEFSDGEVFAMAGGTPEHAALAMQLVRLLSRSLPAECRLFSSDLKLWIAATELATYPDLTIVCGPLERAAHDPNAVTNPRFLVEVTSRSSEQYDRGSKLSQYKQCASPPLPTSRFERERVWLKLAVRRGAEVLSHWSLRAT